MIRRLSVAALLLLPSLLFSSLVVAKDAAILQSQDIFNIEYAADITVSHQGDTVYFVRHFMDITNDRKLGNIWSVDVKTKQLLPVTSGNHLDVSPVLSPDGKKLAFISSRAGAPQIYMKWLESGHIAQLSHLRSAPSGLVWSPDGQTLAFKMFVEKPTSAPVTLSGKPKGAKWADDAVYIDDVYYRFDGGGYASKGSTEIFTLSAQGGSARQLTDDEFDNSGALSWAKDSQRLFFSANRNEQADFKPLNSDIFGLSVADLSISQLTERNGPDTQPVVSPDGKYIAYLGFDDDLSNYNTNQAYVMRVDGSDKRLVSKGLDRSISAIAWDEKGRNLYLQYDDNGSTKLVLQSLKNVEKRSLLSDKLGGQSYGRPYTGAEFSASRNGTVAFSFSDPQRPADVAVISGGKLHKLTGLNEDLLGYKTLGNVEQMWFSSSADDKAIQGWLVYPPNYDKNKKYPLILEIHGGPTTAYGPHFSMEVQLYAAAGNLVLYTNPRGSTSYGKVFANTIDKNYPSQDYDDLMSAVDGVIDKGIVDEDKLFVTGGSGGGVLTAWIVGHTDRFRAAVVAKPVINWISFVLTADFYPYFYQYWFDKKPWEDIDTYMKYSPISYVGNVTTPTMLLTGESDFRTPISETEQFYQALKIQGVETAMVRIPGASHSIYRKPSNLMSKVEYILWWFDKHSSAAKQKD